MTITVPIHNIRIIDFSGLFRSKIEPELLNDLHSYNLIKDDEVNIRNKDVKKLIYHHVIHGLCEYILSLRGKERIVVLYSTLVAPTKDMTQFTHIDECQKFFDTFIPKMIRILPIKFLCVRTTFNKIKADIRKKSGDSIEHINAAKSVVEQFDTSKYTFSKARNFAKRYDLQFLSKNYFTKVKNKQLIFC